MDKLRFRLFKSHLLHFSVVALSALMAVPLVAILGKVAVEGVRNLTPQFFFQAAPTTYQAVVASATGQAIPGGIANGIVGTLLMLLMASAISIPVGILSGVFLAERRETVFAKVSSYMTDILQGTPSIILGVIVYAWIVIPMRGYSAIAGAVALSIMMLPLIVRSTEEAVKMLSTSYKEAALALGASYSRMVGKVLLPSAFGQIFTGVLLAVSRIIGETAPLMFTALGCAIVRWNVTQPMSSVPLLIWQFFNNPTLQPLLWSASLVLLFIVLLLNVSSKIVANKWKI